MKLKESPFSILNKERRELDYIKKSIRIEFRLNRFLYDLIMKMRKILLMLKI